MTVIEYSIIDMNVSLLIIDEQNDFASPQGSLYVPGAEDDCNRLSNFITNNSDKIDNIHMTLDCHPYYHIAHPYFWVDELGNNPPAYTVITYQDIINKKFVPSDPKKLKAAEEYLLNLENRGRYNLTIWPPHCLNATWGFCVVDSVMKAVQDWEHSHISHNVNFIRKASNPMTEHYSAIQAEVPDANDPATRTNFPLIDTLKECDQIIVAGEALSHCVANTVRDLAVYIPVYRITVLTDCTSNVKGYEWAGNNFINEFRAKGMQFETTETFRFLQ